MATSSNPLFASKINKRLAPGQNGTKRVTIVTAITGVDKNPIKRTHSLGGLTAVTLGALNDLLAGIPVNANLRLEIERLVAERDSLLSENAILKRDLADAHAKAANLEQEVELLKAAEDSVQSEQERLRTLNYDPYKNLP